MKQIAVVMVAFLGMCGAGYFVCQIVAPVVSSCIEASDTPSTPEPDWTPDWHLRRTLFRQPCAGLCPDLESGQ
jgi:hypothetical protein